MSEDASLPNTDLKVYGQDTAIGMMAVVEFTHGGFRVQMLLPPEGCIRAGELLVEEAKKIQSGWTGPGLIVPGGLSVVGQVRG
jgi:hypothetical protein